jgi:CxxC motif-containing protein (DUF1111 family)
MRHLSLTPSLHTLMNAKPIQHLAFLPCLLIALQVQAGSLPGSHPRQAAQRPHPVTPTNVPTMSGGRQLLGDPLANLPPALMSDFEVGLEEFNKVETPEGGLGPIFNNVSCVACHGTPSPGGSSVDVVRRFGRNVQGRFDPLDALGGSLLQDFAIDPAVQEVIPNEATVVVLRQSTPLYGAGLIEAIPDTVLIQNAQRPKPDGVRGRAARVLDVASGQVRVGRFGWKCQQATLLSFSGDAYVNEMGVTSRFFPTENAPNGNVALLELFDVTEDPEDAVDPVTGKGDIDHAADFMRFLAPPARGKITPSARQGEAVFQQIGCAVCHIPTLKTGPSPVQALDRQPVNLYSDLLLHDMGSLGDGIAQADAGVREMRTTPLWGLKASAPYLHDGRAKSVDEAIRVHAGEASVSRDRYNRLAPSQRSQLLEFLNSL